MKLKKYNVCVEDGKVAYAWDRNGKRVWPYKWDARTNCYLSCCGWYKPETARSYFYAGTLIFG